MFGVHGKDFFDDYRALLGARSATFDVPVAVRLGVGSYQFDNATLGLVAGYYRAVLRETYDYRPFGADTATRAPQSTTQSFTLSVIPAMLTADYIPFDKQFTGYVGAGAGIAVAAIHWEESLATLQSSFARVGGVRYDESHVVPAAMLRAGISLGLDHRPAARSRAALHFEVNYTWIPLHAKLFERTAATIGEGLPAQNRTYALQAGGIGVHAGVSIFVR